MKSGTVRDARSFDEESHANGFVVILRAFFLVTMENLTISFVGLDFPGCPLVLVLDEYLAVVCSKRTLWILWNWNLRQLEAFE